MKMKKLVIAVALASLGLVGAAQAIPMLQIIGGNAESIGDPGGTAYPSAPNAGPVAGAGLPTALGGWPASANFGADSSFGGALGISGFDQSYLKLTGFGTSATNVTFQFMGKGDATDRNVFQLFLGGAWVTKWDTQGSNGTCGASGSPTPVIDCTPTGSSFSYAFLASDLFAGDLIPFRFVNLTTPGTATNDGTGNGGHDVGGYFLGMDPYSALYDPRMGLATFAGFTDRGCVPGGPCDHDYEDLVVRVSVPEPGTLLLLSAGLLGLAGLRRRKA